MLLFIASAILIAGAFIALYRINLAKSRAAASWPSVEGRITLSRVRTERDREDRRLRYHADVAFAYSVGGADYTGTDVRFGLQNEGRTAAERTCARYPAGASVPVYYDPAKPSRSVLEPGRRPG